MAPNSMAPRSADSASSGRVTNGGGGFASSRCSPASSSPSDVLAPRDAVQQLPLFRFHLLQLVFPGGDHGLARLDARRRLGEAARHGRGLALQRGEPAGDRLLLLARLLELAGDGLELDVGLGLAGLGIARPQPARPRPRGLPWRLSWPSNAVRQPCPSLPIQAVTSDDTDD
jgi:hypothetical protein